MQLFIPLILPYNSPPAQQRFVKFRQLLREYLTEPSTFHHRQGPRYTVSTYAVVNRK